MTKAATGFSRWIIDTGLSAGVLIWGLEQLSVFRSGSKLYIASQEMTGDVNEITFNFVFTDKPCCKKAKAFKKSALSPVHLLAVGARLVKKLSLVFDQRMNWSEDSKIRWLIITKCFRKTFQFNSVNAKYDITFVLLRFLAGKSQKKTKTKDFNGFWSKWTVKKQYRSTTSLQTS